MFRVSCPVTVLIWYLLSLYLYRTDYRVTITGLPVSASWQDLKDHMRQAGPVGFADAKEGRGIVEYETEEDMLYAVKLLDKSEFRNPFTHSVIRVSRISSVVI